MEKNDIVISVVYALLMMFGIWFIIPPILVFLSVALGVTEQLLVIVLGLFTLLFVLNYLFIIVEKILLILKELESNNNENKK